MMGFIKHLVVTVAKNQVALSVSFASPAKGGSLTAAHLPRKTFRGKLLKPHLDQDGPVDWGLS